MAVGAKRCGSQWGAGFLPSSGCTVAVHGCNRPGHRARKYGHAVGMLVSDVGALLTSRDAALWAGGSGSSLCRDVRARRLIRVDRGWYADAERWDQLYAEDRHLLRVVAARRRQPRSSPLVFSHVSAAVLWGLPLWRTDPPRVHVSGITGGGHVGASEPLVARHQVTVPDVDVADVDGVACTSLARTVADTIRSMPAEVALAIADAALRRTAWNGHRRDYDDAAASSLTEEIARRLPQGGRGVRRARAVLQMADGRAESPGESVSRMRLREIGFCDVRIQTRVAGPRTGGSLLTSTCRKRTHGGSSMERGSIWIPTCERRMQTRSFSMRSAAKTGSAARHSGVSRGGMRRIWPRHPLSPGASHSSTSTPAPDSVLSSFSPQRAATLRPGRYETPRRIVAARANRRDSRRREGLSGNAKVGVGEDRRHVARATARRGIELWRRQRQVTRTGSRSG